MEDVIQVQGLEHYTLPPEAETHQTNGHYAPKVKPLLPGIKIDMTRLASFTADDAGNGDAMLALYGCHFLWCGTIGWFTYTGSHWQHDSEGADVKRHVVETLRRRRHAAVEEEKEAVVQCTKGDDRRVTGCINRFKTLVNVAIDEFDCDPDLLNCKNGVVDLRTGAITPHSRAQRFTYCTPVGYNPRADTFAWTTYLEAVVGGGQEVIDYLRMALGYSFTGHTREEVLFYLFGPTRSGKGSLAEAISKLLPEPIANTVEFATFTAKREGDASNFDLAPLKPCRIIFASESNRTEALNPAKIKQMTGGDRLTCCFKHRDHFSYKPRFKVWMLSNFPVNGDPEDNALWGRVRVIEFPHSYLDIEDKTRKEGLSDTPVQEGILAWIVEGAKQWYALGPKGLIAPQSVRDTTKKQRAELDFVQQWLDECCTVDPQAWTSNEVIATSYSQWCKNNNVQFPKGAKGLAQSLKIKGYEVGMLKREGGDKPKRGVQGFHLFDC